MGKYKVCTDCGKPFEWVNYELQCSPCSHKILSETFPELTPEFYAALDAKLEEEGISQDDADRVIVEGPAW